MSKRTLLVAVAAAAVMGTHGRIAAQDTGVSATQETSGGGRIDATLAELFRLADEGNASIRSFQSAIAEAETGIKAAKAERLPDVDAEAAFSYLGGGRITDRNFTSGFGVHIPHYGNNLALKASVPVYAGGAITSGINLSRLAAEMARTEATDNRQRVRMLIAGHYLQLLNLRNQERVFDENIALTETLIAHTRKRQQEGVVLRNDITRYELQREQLLLGRTQVRNQAKIIGHQLETAIGGEPSTGDPTPQPLPREGSIYSGTLEDLLYKEVFEDSLSTDASSQMSETPLFAEVTTPLPREGLGGGVALWQSLATANAPALQRSQLGIDMSEEKVRMERSARRPTVAVVAEEHLDGPITVEIPNLNKNLNYFFVGVGVRYRFGALWKNNQRVQQARQATQTARERHTATAEQLENAVQAAYTDYQTAQTELETSRKSVELASQNYDVIHNRYQNGLALVTDMVDAANQRLDAQLRLVNSRINVLYNYYNLKFITGTL